MNGSNTLALGLALALSLIGCSSEDGMSGSGEASSAAGSTSVGSGSGSTTGAGGNPSGVPHDPATAPRASVDRFSATAGHLMVRDDMNGLPQANVPVVFDEGPFITQGLGPAGEVVRYYNFDVQPTTPAPIYAFFAEGASAPLPGQLNVVDVLPGEPGYNDFWHVMKVTVPSDYVANTIASLAELQASGYAIEPTELLVNCPIVPDGSTAELRGGGESTDLHSGWYQGKLVKYFTFEESALMIDGDGSVPLSSIYVTFNTNPDQPNGGPPSGFKTEPDGVQTHNVVATLPSQPGYSPLWDVDVYDNAAFDSVADIATATQAGIVAEGVANVNCPVVSVATN